MHGRGHTVAWFVGINLDEYFRSAEEVEKYRTENQISVLGDVPAPVQGFDECEIPEYCLSEISKQGFTAPTPIQAQFWPAALAGNDIVGVARTGSGKTLAVSSFTCNRYCHLRGK